jgi:diacylglycerol kinase (CTP)
LRGVSGVVPSPVLPAFGPACIRFVAERINIIMSSSYANTPSTPRVISPSPTPSALSNGDEYFPPTTRSAAKRRMGSHAPIDEIDEDSEVERRARTRSRSPLDGVRKRRMSGFTTVSGKPLKEGFIPDGAPIVSNGGTNGHLKPPQSVASYWRELSRSPSPLGLIPIHRQWRSFVSFPQVNLLKAA